MRTRCLLWRAPTAHKPFRCRGGGALRDDLPDDLKGELKEDADVYLPRAVIGSGCHVCEVEIDSETGV